MRTQIFRGRTVSAFLLILPHLVSAEDSLLFEPDIPQVLTPVRLQQPLAETPASVTVITAEQIRLWGVSDLPSVFQFVPGMFVGREINSNSMTVLYHSGDVELARRLEVLVDGRSVYKASFANVDWDQLNIALEDVERIEITRGPSASSYGMNAFQGVIHIITRHPADSQPGRVLAEYGTGQRRHGYASVTNITPEHQERLSVFGRREGEFGGYHADSGKIGGFPDQTQVKGVNLSGAWQVDTDSSLRWQVGRQQMFRDQIADSNFQKNSPEQEAISDVGWLRWKSQLSPDHEIQLQTYWQGDNSEVNYHGCAPSMAFDPRLPELYRSNPEMLRRLTSMLFSVPASGLSPEEIQALNGLVTGTMGAAGMSALTGVPVTDEEFDTIHQVARDVYQANALDETICGDGNNDIYEQRYDAELQDTMRWSDTLRTVQGIGFRKDQVSSETYMGGTVHSSQWLAFLNAEYRPVRPVIVSAAAMVEYEAGENTRFSPRLGLNYLFGQQQSLRLQISQSHRSPDLAERYLQTSAALHNMSSNYLDLDSGSLFYNTSADAWRDTLQDEKLIAWEVGYYGFFYQSSLQVNVKYFEERMEDLISTQLTLLSTNIGNVGGMHLRGVEGQVSWQPTSHQTLLISGLLQDRDADRSQELLLGSEQSLRIMWTHKSDRFEQSFGAILDHSVIDTTGNSANGGYKQQKLVWRLGADTGIGKAYWSGVYDFAYDEVLFETTPRWLNRVGWEYDW